MVIVLMGVSGSGKTTIGKILADRLGWTFVEADDFHSPANVAKMRAGTPLNDADRAPWLAALREVADAWTRGAVKVPPPGWAVDGGRLRWWCLSAGIGEPGMYTLALGASDEPAWTAVGAALATAGVPGALVGPRAAGPAYRIVGQRRLTRLRELVGEPPAGVPDNDWPSDIRARI